MGWCYRLLSYGIFLHCCNTTDDGSQCNSASVHSPRLCCSSFYLATQRKSQKKDWFVIAAVFLGMVLFFVDKAGIGNMLGNVLGVLSGISFATFIVCTRMQKNAHPAGSIFLGNVIALVVCLPSMIVTPLTEDAIFDGMYLGLIYGGLSYIIYSACIRYVSALSAILIATIEPVLNPVWVFFLVGETPSSYAILGGGIVVVSILIGNLTGLCEKERK